MACGNPEVVLVDLNSVGDIFFLAVSVKVENYLQRSVCRVERAI